MPHKKLCSGLARKDETLLRTKFGASQAIRKPTTSKVARLRSKFKNQARALSAVVGGACASTAAAYDAYADGVRSSCFGQRGACYRQGSRSDGRTLEEFSSCQFLCHV